ncbi:GTP-binding protein Era [Buchnera aphidicola str. Ak (Acyrthosiphon kondoi)]|uniref:GTPase Era n=1 Tax=Buchnera aphidicola str. Ak (Acyrthosiphon kondoi) TaxID=1005090 RepID=G2LMX2_9GAMM|nr:GTPase Era [Buchnera aphidicola]AEO08610.1 GTP-binding protein Era [Buchnera aphidicola str. Ak (Acyrthosiphon kondoi)]
MKKKQQYCGYISIIGKANVGKSTLLNNIIGKKISIVSRKKNTTQSNITGIKTQNYHQFIYIDTPGIIFDKKNNQIQYKKNNFYEIIKTSILIIFIIDRVYWTEEDEKILNEIKKNKIPIIIAINKIDKITKKIILLPFIAFLKKKIDIVEIIPISAKRKKSIITLNDIIKSYLPKTSHIYPEFYITTNSKFFTTSEIIREQLILFLGDELPSIIKVEIESFYKKEQISLHIRAVIWVENIRQKGIVIGHNGEKIKKISIIARNNIEKEFHIKTHLLLWVKYKN